MKNKLLRRRGLWIFLLVFPMLGLACGTEVGNPDGEDVEQSSRTESQTSQTAPSESTPASAAEKVMSDSSPIVVPTTSQVSVALPSGAIADRCRFSLSVPSTAAPQALWVMLQSELGSVTPFAYKDDNVSTILSQWPSALAAGRYTVGLRTADQKTVCTKEFTVDAGIVTSGLVITIELMP